jgi:hypothetical protein
MASYLLVSSLKKPPSATSTLLSSPILISGLLCRFHLSESFALTRLVHLLALLHTLFSAFCRKLEPTWFTMTQIEAGYKTDAIDVTDVLDGYMADLAGLLADNVQSPGYYIRQWKEFDELEDTKED